MISSAHSIKNKKKAIVISCAVFIVFLIIPIFLGVFYSNTDSSMTEQVLAQQETVAAITASAIKIKVDRLTSIAIAMASSSDLVSFAASGQWDKAADVTRDLQNDTAYYDTYIDRIVLFDQNGVEQAAYPTLSSGVGSSAASSSWYQSLNAGAPFYVSNVTQRTAVPRINDISIAVPIVQNNIILGTLVLQVPTTNFLEFGESASLGTYGFIYIVDSAGNVIAHPKYSSDNGVVNLSSSPIVQLALEKKEGVDVISNQDYTNALVTYQPVAGYNWEVVTQEPYDEAFATRSSILRVIAWEMLSSVLIGLLIAFTIFFLMTQGAATPKKRTRRATTK